MPSHTVAGYITLNGYEMKDAAFWAAIIGFPVVIAMCAAGVRSYKGAPPGTAADIVGALVALDFTAIVDPAAFSSHIASVASGDHSIALPMALSMFLCGLIWCLCILELEPKMLARHISRAHTKPPFPFILWLSTWAGTMVMFAANAAVFLGKVPL
jgi:hypothetical protein